MYTGKFDTFLFDQILKNHLGYLENQEYRNGERNAGNAGNVH